MNHCPECRQKLVGNEKYYPNWGEDLQQYAVALELGKDGKNSSIAVDWELKLLKTPGTTENNIIKSKETSTTKQQITTVLHEVQRIEKKEGTDIREIKAGDLQISRTEPRLKEYVSKGNECRYKKEYSKSISHYDKALKIEPTYVDALFNKAFALVSLGKYEEAIEWLDKVIVIDPNYADALNNRGFALYKLSKYEEAIEWYDKVLGIYPNNVFALNNKGLALFRLKRLDEAIQCSDKAIELDPSYANAWYNRSCYMVKKGEINEL